MGKFIFGAAVGFVSGAMFVTHGLLQAYKRDGSLMAAEAAIARGINKGSEFPPAPRVQPLTANQIRNMRGL